MPDNRAEVLKKLLIRFRKQHLLQTPEECDGEALSEFSKLLDLNSQLATPKGLCASCWSLVSEAQYKTHEGQHGHRMVKADSIPSKETFIQVAMKNGKAKMDATQTVLQSIQLPLSAPTPVLQMTVQDGPSMLSNQGGATSNMSNSASNVASNNV